MQNQKVLMTVRLIQMLFLVNVIIPDNSDDMKKIININPYFRFEFYAKNLFS